MTSVFVAASAPLIKAGLEALVAQDRDLTIAATRETADVFVVDVGGADIDEEHTFAAFASDDLAPEQSIVVLTAHPRQEWLHELLRNNDVVRAVVSRDAAPDAIFAAIMGAAAGFVVIPRSSLDSLIPIGSIRAARNGSTQPAEAESALTRREIEVLTMLTEGVGNKTIAARMGISEHTVKFHIASIFSKLGASSRTEAVTLGARQGLILL